MSKKLKTRNKILLIASVSLGCFIIYTVAFYSYKGWQWDSLFPYVLGVGGVAEVLTAIVAIADKVVNNKKKGE